MPNIPQLAQSDPITVTVASALPALSLNRSDLAATITITPSGTASAPVAAFNSAIASSNGTPYTNSLTGTITTDASGNASLNLGSWSWVGYSGYQRVEITMLGIYPTTPNGDLGWWTGVMVSAMQATVITSGFVEATTSLGTITFNANASTGVRSFAIAGIRANTTYNYEIRALALNSALSPGI